MFLRQSILSTNKIVKEIAVLECEKGNCVDCIYVYKCTLFWDLKIYMFLRRSLAHVSCIHDFFFLVGTIGGLAPIAVVECEKGNCVDCIYVYKCTLFWDLKIYMFLRRSLAHVSCIHDFFFGRYNWGSCPPPPPQYQKAVYATVENLRTTKDYGPTDRRTLLLHILA